MKTVTVRDLRYDFKKVERILRQGEELQLTKRNVVIARLIPSPIPSSKHPDFLARLRATYGDRAVAQAGAEVARQDRDRY